MERHRIRKLPGSEGRWRVKDRALARTGSGQGVVLIGIFRGGSHHEQEARGKIEKSKRLRGGVKGLGLKRSSAK